MRSTILSIAFGFAFASVGCSGGGDNQPSANQSKQQKDVEKKFMQMGLAFHNYADTFNHLPTAGMPHNKGLSWRVAILPFIEEENLFKQIRHDEPWDSPHNKQFLAKMPDFYKHPAADTPPGHTIFRGFVGTGTMTQPRPIGAGIPDGTSNTIALIEAGQAVPWTKPDELDVRPGQPLPKIGGHWIDGSTIAVQYDGRVIRLLPKFDETVFRLAVNPADGQIFDWDKLTDN